MTSLVGGPMILLCAVLSSAEISASVNATKNETQTPEMQPMRYPASHSQYCNLKQDQGELCGDGKWKSRFWFDIKQNKCSQFWYGGCKGNHNRFATVQDCENVCKDPKDVTAICHLPFVHGRQLCPDAEPSLVWYFDTERSDCARKWFYCQGNKNNFATEAECENQCEFDSHRMQPSRNVTTRSTTPTGMPILRLSSASTPATKNEHKLHRTQLHNQREARSPVDKDMQHPGATQQDTSGIKPDTGIKDDDARPIHRENVTVVEKTTYDTEVCILGADEGTCETPQPQERFFYDHHTGQCQKFFYNGCEGNANNFPTQTACETICNGVVGPKPNTMNIMQPSTSLPAKCLQEKKIGPCDDYTTLWYYNHRDGVCTRFYYGGCDGTENRFNSKEECENECENHLTARMICKLPKVKGPCKKKIISWYYDKSVNECKSFEYGGCFGNKNRFNNKGKCIQKCVIFGNAQQPGSPGTKRTNPSNNENN